MSIERFVAEAQKPETIAALNAAVASVEPDPRGCLVFPLAMVERIGHLGIEPHYLASMFGERYRRIIVVTGPRRLPGVNAALWDMLAGSALPGVALAETDHPIVPKLGILNQGLVPTGTYDLYLAGPNRFYREYTAHRLAGGGLVHYALPEPVAERGALLLASLGLDEDAPFVFVHARERAYVPDPAKQAHGDLRSVEIESFRPALDWLVERGLAVIRAGTPDGPRLDHPSGRVIDLAHHPARAPWMDVFLCARCVFGVTTQSGPEALLRGFGRPHLATNLLPTVYSHHLSGDRFLFKPVFQGDRPEPLSYEEQLAAGLPNRLVAGPLPDADFYRDGGYRFTDLDGEVLAEAVEEMLAPAEEEATAQRQFRDLGAAYQRSIESDARAKAGFADLYPYADARFGRLSRAVPEGFVPKA